MSNIKQIMHSLSICRTLAKYDALFLLEDLQVPKTFIRMVKMLSARKYKGSRGGRLAAALQELGPTFIKLGQALSMRPDLIGEDVAQDLAHLQDRLPPFPTEQALQVIKNEFGEPADKLFADFDRTPVAAASIAQVHFATDHDGNRLAVKILRPDVEAEFARDVEYFYWVARVVEKHNPQFERLRLREVVDVFAGTVKLEMDLRMEAAAASELRENFKWSKDLQVPKVIWPLTSRRVLTLERISGIRISDREAIIKAGHDVDEILQRLTRVFFNQVLRDGYFHADMHPGNLFVGENGQIIAVDFGIMGRLDRQTRIFLAEMALGFLQRDYQKVADVHFAAGYMPDGKSREMFAQACRAIGEHILDRPQSEISVAKLLALLFKVTEDFNMPTQPQLLLLQKTMVAFEGLGRSLNPQVNLWQLSQPVIEGWVRKNLGVEGKIRDKITEAKLLNNRINNLLQLTDYIPQIISKDGLKLSPETIENIVGNNSNHKKGRLTLWQTIIITIIISTITTLAILRLS